MQKGKELKVPTEKDKYLLSARSSMPISTIDDICLHHEQVFLTKFSSHKWKCCNPFQKHKKVRSNNLKVIDISLYEKIKGVPAVVPGEKLCVECYIFASNLKADVAAVPEKVDTVEETPDPSKQCSDFDPENSSEEEDAPMDYILDTEINISETNEVLAALDVTPVKTKGLTMSQRSAKAGRKLNSATQNLKRKLEDSFSVELESSIDKELKSHAIKQKLADIERYEDLMSKLKEKFHSPGCSYALKLQILTLSPFGIKRTMTEFQASHYLVKQSRKLVKTVGILGERGKSSKGKTVTPQTRDAIVKVYESDDYSRMTPGLKEFKSVRNELGEKVHVQKRLMLINLKELYAQYKAEGNPPVGFSTFAAVRPPWCVLAGPKGTHAICICTHHQNPQLMLSAFGSGDIPITLKDLMEKTVCDVESEKCMMRMCKNCPGEEGIKSDADLVTLLDFQDEVQYKQWVSTDQTKLLTITDSCEDFLEKLAGKIVKLTRHHFIAKAQSSYLKSLKDSLTSSEAIIQGDFAENYSFIIQDEAQGFHWENSQATLHPFVVYYRSDDGGALKHASFCMISDSRMHNTSAVYSFQCKLLPLLKDLIPTLKKVHYFSDGCVGQYKNRYNFINLCHHKIDFELDCEWNFFATSHGKGPCDGIGGTVKRKTAKTSLQRPVDGQILTPHDMFLFCLTAFPNITFNFVSEKEINTKAKFLEERFSSALVIKGTQSFHRFVPISNCKLKVSAVSTSEPHVVNISVETTDDEADQEQEIEFTTGGFISCIYDNKFWIGLLEDQSDEFGDYSVRFMHPAGRSKEYKWPNPDDTCWIPKEHMLCAVHCPALTSSTSRNYTVLESDIKMIETLWTKKEAQCH